MLKSEQKVVFEEMGLEGPALTLALKAGAHTRHQARVRHCLNTSYGHFGDLQAWGLLMELHGTGGRHGAALQTPSTERMGIVGGSGRRHAGDGQSWQAALLCAYIGAMGETPSVTVMIDEEGILCLKLAQGQATASTPFGVEVEDWYSGYVVAEVSLDTLLERTPLAFVSALVRHGLLEALGLDGRGESAIDFNGDITLWGLAVNACEKAQQAQQDL